jgi:hypothetical protein
VGGDVPRGGRSERAERADRLSAARRGSRELESARAQALVDRFVEEAARRGLPTEELTARPWSGAGRYRTGVEGWYLRRDRSVGVGTDGRYYQLVVAPVPFGRWRRVRLAAASPPLQVGEGARDGESIALESLLALRLAW